MSGDNSEVLISMQQTLVRMDEHLMTVCADVENLKHTHSTGGQEAQLPDGHQPGTLHSNVAHSVVSTPENGSSGDEDNIIIRLSWEEHMQLEDNQDADKVGSAVKHPKGEKLCLTKVEENTENFLHEAFTPMDNEDCKDLRIQFIVRYSQFPG